MNKTELIAEVAKKCGMSKKDAEKAVAAFTSAVTDALVKGEKVQIVGFGTFEVRDKKAKMTINPRTKEKKEVPAKKAPAFKPGKALKEAVDVK